jgi:type IV secretory pathway TrbL component
MFLSYIKALAAVGVKMLMLCLCLGIIRNIMSGWPGMIQSQLDNAESIFSFLMPMACALLGFYMILKAVPQFASSVLTGSVSGFDGGLAKSAAMAGYGLGVTVWQMSRTAAQKVIGGASVVSQAAQTYQYTSQAARDTGSDSDGAKAAGAKEAATTVMTGSQPGGPRAAGERIYSDHQRAAQFADVRSGGADNLSAPPGTNQGNQAKASATQVSGAAASGVSIAGAKEVADIYSPPSGNDNFWGSYASDRKKEGGNKA